MENKTDNKTNNGKIAIIAAIITAVAGIITTIVTISGPLIEKNIAIQTTQTREAFLAAATIVGGVTTQRTGTPTPVSPTAAPVDLTQPEKPAAAPTVTLPAPLPPVSTVTRSTGDVQPQVTEAAERMLKVGESVTSNGITVTLTQIEVPAGNEIRLRFTFTNTTDKVVNITLDHNRDVTLIDDKGTVYQWATAFSWEVSIYPGTSRNDTVMRRGDVSKASYFIVKLEIPGLLSAQWKK